MNTIAFPGLGLSFNIDPTAFELFGREIKWYALIITTGLILGILFAVWQGKKQGVSSDNILDIAIFGTPTAIIFARAYYVICEWSYYSKHKDEIIQVWNGGIAIYGAIIGAVTAAYIYCKVKKLNVGKIFDIACLSLFIGQAIGRWGNFVNAEAHGTETALPWRMYISEINMSVHPTFLYESLWNVLGFILLYIYSKHKKFHGEVFLMYITWYGVGRAFIEGLRTDSLYIASTGIRTSQLLAIITVIISACTIAYKRYKIHKAN